MDGGNEVGSMDCRCWYGWMRFGAVATADFMLGLGIYGVLFMDWGGDKEAFKTVGHPALEGWPALKVEIGS